MVLGAIDRLHPGGCTNLWDGLKTGMSLLNDDLAKTNGTGTASSRLPTLFILTDGMPNVNPPRGHIPMLKSYIDSHPTTQQFSISTFGFGYSLDTPLLLKIAQVGGGGYGFIPDSGMVGTVFVHAVANAYSTYAPRAILDVEVPDGTDLRVHGGLSVTKTSWGVQIDAGDIQFGQEKSYILSFNEMPPTIAATATYRPFTAPQDIRTDTVALNNTAMQTPNYAGIEYHVSRLELVEILFAAKTTNLSESSNDLKTLHRRITVSPYLANHADALAIAQDASGEGLLALQPKNFSRWGRHYFPSLALGHQRQQCGNFKDPGLQVYGRDSPLFIEERDQLDAAFDALPPPTPSAPPPPSYSQANSARFGTTYGRVSSMASYRSVVGPCFAGHCLLMGPDGEQMRVDQLKRGMEVTTLKGLRKVAAVVRTSSSAGETVLCQIGDGLEITPWHPIRTQRQGQWKWVFPADTVEPRARVCDAIYSILLVSHNEKDIDAHTVSIGGVWCVTLGHGLVTSESGDIRAHSFLGNYQKVLAEISRLDGFYETDGVAHSSGTKRSAVDGKICGFFASNDGPKYEKIVHGMRKALYL
jgi:hypothetical protein